MCFELGPSQSAALASAPGHAFTRPETDERDQRCVRSVSASHHSFDEHSYLVCFRFIVTDSSSGVYPMGCRPPGPETHALHGAPGRFGGSRAHRGGVLFPEPGLSGPRWRLTEPLTPLSRLPLDTGARFSRARWPIRRGRQDRFLLPFVKRSAGSRSGMPSIDKRRAALLPPFRAAIARPVTRSRGPRVAPGRLHEVLEHLMNR